MYNYKSHFDELRSRSMYISLSLVCAFLVSYYKATQITYIFLFSFLSMQEQPQNFICTDIYEAFSSTIAICLISSLFSILPYVVYHVLCFLLPSWHNYERELGCRRALITLFLWMVYMYVIHSHLIPRVCSFFLLFQVEEECLTISIEPRILPYISWASHILGVAALFFLFACILYLCIKHRKMSPKLLSKQRKLYLFVCFLFAGFISPPELWSQSFLTLFLCSMCEVLIWVCFVYERLKNFSQPQSQLGL